MASKTDWEKEHYYTQRKGDYTEPTACSNCSGKLEKTDWGWRCKECQAQINGQSFYQGRNSKEREILEKIKMLEGRGMKKWVTKNEVINLIKAEVE